MNDIHTVSCKKSKIVFFFFRMKNIIPFTAWFPIKSITFRSASSAGCLFKDQLIVL